MIEKINFKANERFKEDYIGLLAFGSYFQNKKSNKGEGDIDLAIVLNGKLNHSNLDKIKSFNKYLSDSLGNDYVHSPFYTFVDEPMLKNPFLYNLFFYGSQKTNNKEKIKEIKNSVLESLSNSEPISLSLSKEHSHFARRCLIDNVLFDDTELTSKIYKNHTTTAMRMMNYLETGKFIPDSYNVWKNWLNKSGIEDSSCSYKSIIKNLKDPKYKLDIHISIVDAISKYEVNNKNERNNQ